MCSFSQERAYIPEGQRYSIQNTQAAFCFSETIPAPTGKDEAQQRSVSGHRGPRSRGLPHPKKAAPSLSIGPWAVFSPRRCRVVAGGGR